MVSRRGACVRATVAVLAFLWLASPAPSWARTQVVIPYPIASVWPAAVRFMRVDRNFPIHEKDDEAGYILFEHTDGPKPCRASLELIRVTDADGRDATRLAVNIPDLPRRYEQMLLDKLATKVREDHGPPAPPPRKPEPAKPDGGPPPATPPPQPPPGPTNPAP
jgi:hypothetical protein